MPGDLTSIKRETIQSRVRDDKTPTSLLLVLAQVGQIIPAWWSENRDRKLRDFWKGNDYLSGAVYTIESRMSTIPVTIQPKDHTIPSHQRLAEQMSDILANSSEFGEGWDTFVGKWVQDLTTQDKGAFAEIIGPGDPMGPLTGPAFGIAHLDAARCTRTANPEFPVIYTDTDSRKYKLHYSRVAYASLQTSPMAEMNGVGYCSVSRCVNTSQRLLDILIYNQEKLGSRPHRSILVAKGGLDPDDIKAAFEIANEDMSNALLSRFSKTAVVGDASIPEAGMDMIDLASLPDGFDEEKSTMIGMAAIALAFGVDARELWPGLSTGATRAEALVTHLKARTKGLGQLIQITERAIGPKFLPPTLTMQFDYQDDAQDRQVADIRQVRSNTHEVDLRSGVVDIRAARETMLDDQDISQSQFDELELGDGRMPDGSSVLSLFYNPDYLTMLNMGLPDPLTIPTTDLKPIIVEKRAELLKGLGVVVDFKQRRMIREALAALDELEAEKPVKAPAPPALQANAQTPPPPPQDLTQVTDTQGAINVAAEGGMMAKGKVLAMLELLKAETPTIIVQAASMEPIAEAITKALDASTQAFIAANEANSLMLVDMVNRQMEMEADDRRQIKDHEMNFVEMVAKAIRDGVAGMKLPQVQKDAPVIQVHVEPTPVTIQNKSDYSKHMVERQVVRRDTSGKITETHSDRVYD